jgi:hypothetical protein
VTSLSICVNNENYLIYFLADIFILQFRRAMAITGNNHSDMVKNSHSEYTTKSLCAEYRDSEQCQWAVSVGSVRTQTPYAREFETYSPQAMAKVS